MRVEVVAAGKEVEELMLPKLSPVEEVLVSPLPKFSPKPVEAAVVVAAFVVAAAADVKLKPGVEEVPAVLELKPPRLKLRVGAVDAVVADDNPTPPLAEALEVVDKRGWTAATAGAEVRGVPKVNEPPPPKPPNAGAAEVVLAVAPPNPPNPEEAGAVALGATPPEAPNPNDFKPPVEAAEAAAIVVAVLIGSK